MKYSPGFMRSIAAVLFLAVCAYCGAALSGLLSAGEELYMACLSHVRSTVSLEGLCVRHEQLVNATDSKLCVQDGSRLSAGTVLAQNGENRLYAESSSVFFEGTDGYEYLSPDIFQDLTVSSFSGILKCKPKPNRSSVGRLVTENDWYFAALCPADTALSAGEGCTLRFEDIRQPVRARVMSISPEYKGSRAVLLRLSAGGPELLSLRFCSAELLSGGYTGIKFPASALEYDEQGEQFVTVLFDGAAMRRQVDIIYTAPDGQWMLSARSAESDCLSPGDMVICLR